MKCAYRYRLYPTAKQAAALSRWAGCARAVWNAGLEQRQMAWRMNGVGLRYESQGGTELSAAKREHHWLAEPHSDVLQQALRDLDRAFTRFFVGGARYPRFKRKRRDAFRIQSRPSRGEIAVRLNRKWGEVRIPKLGWVRLRWSRKPEGEIKHLTVRRNALGWHVSLCCEREAETPPPHRGPPVGIDRGVATSVALSTGKLLSCPTLPPGQLERLRRLQRRAGRQETARRRRPNGQRRRSARHQRTLDAVARLRAREARIRADFLHKLSTNLAKSHGVVAIERLDVRAMTRSAAGTLVEPGTNVKAKAGLNRSILAQGWGELRRQLAYKCGRHGSCLVEVPAAYTSLTCARCGAVDERSRREQRFACTACGHSADADVNAARNILAAGQVVTARGALAGGRGTEPRTTRPELADVA
ncbi:MAG: RNA-guided endonuclease InsQ/TnpB family protein [Solirubrobacterales bacterium]